MLNLHFITVGSFVGSICKQISLTLRCIADAVSVHCRRRHRLRTFFPGSKKNTPDSKMPAGSILSLEKRLRMAYSTSFATSLAASR